MALVIAFRVLQGTFHWFNKCPFSVPEAINNVCVEACGSYSMYIGVEKHTH